jgi:hypothetical protein
MNLIVSIAYAAIGLVLISWAVPLSIRYNAWTTRLRERHPNVHLPPTPESRARNTKIMTGIFRILGVFFVLLAILYALPMIFSTKTG